MKLAERTWPVENRVGEINEGHFDGDSGMELFLQLKMEWSENSKELSALLRADDEDEEH